MTHKSYWLTKESAILAKIDWEKYNAKLSDQDIREMQTIDADCNDCKYFQRGQLQTVPGLKYFKGHCKKFDKPTKAYPVQYSGHECFEHRKA